MADMPEEISRSQSSPADLQRQIEDLRSDVEKIRDSVSDLLDRASEGASDLYDGAADAATWAGTRLKSQAQTISQAVQDNPGAISSAFIAGGIVGMMIGLLLGHSDRHHRLF